VPYFLNLAHLPSAVIVVLQKYVQTPNLAEYLGLNPVDALHLSVPLNIIFIGFKGEGNSKVSVVAGHEVALACTAATSNSGLLGATKFAAQLFNPDRLVSRCTPAYTPVR